MDMPKALVFALIVFALPLGGIAPAQASAARIRLHVSDFYAHAPEEPARAVRPAAEAEQTTSCYVSLSATEVSRGIRHWTNKC